jgi:hypothetical protein
MPLGDSGRGPESYTKYASNLGLDAGTFKSCIESDKYLADIRASGQGAGAIEEKQGGSLEGMVGNPCGFELPFGADLVLEENPARYQVPLIAFFFNRMVSFHHASPSPAPPFSPAPRASFVMRRVI